MYSKNKIIKNVILVLAILIILIILLCSLGDIKEIGSILGTQTVWYMVLLAVAVTILYAVFYQIPLMVLVRQKYKNVSLIDLFCISGSEFFFNAITPFSSGGQPFQAYALKRKDVKISDSTSCLLQNFLSYQIVLNLYCTISIIFYYTRIKAQVDNIVWLIIVGFTINTLVMLFIILIGRTKFMGKAIIGIMNLFCKIKFIDKHFGSKRANFEQYVAEMQQTFKEINKKYVMWILCIICKVVALGIYYSIPYLAFLSIGVNLGADNYLYTIAITSFSLTMTIFLPTPGASGGAELAFTTFFKGLIETGDSESIALSGMLIWRLMTYYMLIFYGMALYLIFERRSARENRNIY